MKTLLEVANLDVVYQGAIHALNGMTLTVPEGQIVALLGPNGAGKTTTLKAISGFLPLEGGSVTHGTITFDGADLLSLPPYALPRRGLFHVREGRYVFPHMSVEENLVAARFALSGRGRARAEAFDEVYDFFPVLAKRRTQYAGLLSGGEQQMLAMGRALVAEPRLILLDEPSLGLAPMIVEEIFNIVSKINREKKVTILVVEQNAMVAMRHAHYGYIVETGRSVLEGTVAELMNNAEVRSLYLGVGHTSEAQQRSPKTRPGRARSAWLA
jgi:branched-chain amino acid transport system ATP-binding protein